MTPIWTLLILCAMVKTAKQSIVGVTYRDNFDFEERYSDINECNPFYWHPLHLPEKCAELFETAIRAKVASAGPVRIMSNRNRPKAHKHKHEYAFKPDPPRYTFSTYDMIMPNFRPHIYNIDDFSYDGGNPMSPYGEMMSLLRNDISYLPTAPKITTMPGLGLVALYEQPISKQSAASIKKVGELYKKLYRQRHNPYDSEVILKYEENAGGGKKKKSRKSNKSDSRSNTQESLQINDKT